MLVGHVLQGVRYRRELVGPERRGDENNARMLDVRGNEFPRQLREVNNVARDDRTAFAGGVPQLASVVELGVADLVSTDHIQPTRAMDLRDVR